MQIYTKEKLTINSHHRNREEEKPSLQIHHKVYHVELQFFWSSQFLAEPFDISSRGQGHIMTHVDLLGGWFIYVWNFSSIKYVHKLPNVLKIDKA